MKDKLVSIILPFYNSKQFLESAIHCIRSQTYQSFELILIDDGSSDGSLELSNKLTSHFKQIVIFLKQENQGSYAARNAGLKLATGQYITFFDVDDLWTSTHLEECIYYLDKYNEVDIVYTNCQMVDLNNNGQVTHKSVFHENEKSNKFLELKTRKIEHLNLINDHRAVRYQILHGLFLGLQFTVFRSEVFKTYRFNSQDHNEAEDQLSTIKFLKQNLKIGYLTNIHGTYNLHSSNSSAANKLASRERKIWITERVIAGYCKLSSILNTSEKIALRKRIANEYFWGLGYNIGLEYKDYNFALKKYIKGIWYWPFDIKKFKSLSKLIIFILLQRLKRV